VKQFAEFRKETKQEKRKRYQLKFIEGEKQKYKEQLQRDLEQVKKCKWMWNPIK
jgi:hypothetical protein